jgi:hypothetical protein
MSKIVFTDVARLATNTVSRRASLTALAAASVLMGSRPIATQGAKAGKKTRRKCKRQDTQCRAFYVDVCDTNQSCTDATNTCCAYFGRCAAGEAIRCLGQLI